MNVALSRETFRSRANRRARRYTRDDLALTWAQMAMSSDLRAMQAAIRMMSRDEIIRDLRDEVKARIGGNGVRAAYIAERLGRMRDRRMVRNWAEEIAGKYDVIGRAA